MHVYKNDVYEIFMLSQVDFFRRFFFLLKVKHMVKLMYVYMFLDVLLKEKGQKVLMEYLWLGLII